MSLKYFITTHRRIGPIRRSNQADSCLPSTSPIPADHVALDLITWHCVGIYKSGLKTVEFENELISCEGSVPAIGIFIPFQKVINGIFSGYNDSAFVNVFRANVIKIGNSYLDNVSSRDVYKCGIIVCRHAFPRHIEGILLRDTVVHNRNLTLWKDLHVCMFCTICINNDRTFDRIDFIELGSVHSHSV